MQKYRIATVQNAVSILQLFTREQPEWNLSELSRQLDINISSTKRLLTTLMEHGYLQKDQKTKRYSLGFSILALCGVVTTTMEIHREAQPVLEELVRDLGETVHLGVLEGTTIVYLTKIESPHPVSLFSHIGKKNPAYCTGCGKVMLAFQKPALQKSILAEIESTGYYPFGQNTVSDSTELMVHLKKIKKQGYSVCVDEFHEGVSIASPIYDFTGEVIASVSVTGLNSRITIQDIPYFTKHVIEAGKSISKKLGYYF